jgi:hypothetical protein
VVQRIRAGQKDDGTLVDVIVEKLYGIMRDFDAGRAKKTVELIVDRDTAAASKFRALLDVLWSRGTSDSPRKAKNTHHKINSNKTLRRVNGSTGVRCFVRGKITTWDNG